ncbi:uncharacterized protein [Nicotiana tomentosiformis]|uniref:uncharacterized protein n=1 Tax=Nicotiana tomentosiformis TaxID=4098 RepID=UPI00388C62EF
MQGLQTPGVPLAQSIDVAQAQVGHVMTDDEQRRLERFGRLQPPSFSGDESRDAQDFLDIWWEAYERCMPVDAASLIWHEFSVLFLEKFVPLSHREELRKKFEQLRQDGISMTQYEISCNRERVSAVTFDEVVDIARQIEMVHSQEREEREAKKPRGSGAPNGVHSGGQSYHNKSRPYRPAQTARPVHRGASSSHSPYSTRPGQSSLSALPAQCSSRSPSVQGSFVPGSSDSYCGSRGPPQYLSLFFKRGCFECGELRHVKRFSPHLRRGPV